MTQASKAIHRTFPPWTTSPVFLTVTTSVTIFLVVGFLGFWDVEDLFVSGSSIGAHFGLGRSAVNRTNDLIYSLMGVPLLDFGIIGGYRLPFQGTINTGPLWVFRSVLPAELILGLTQLISMLIAAISFGRLWKHTQRQVGQNIGTSNLLCLICWTSLSLPTFEYLLQQDWFAVSIVNHGFITIVTSLMTVLYDFQNQSSSTTELRRSVRLVLLGSYFAVLGHTGTLVLYSPTIFLLAFLVGYQTWRFRTGVTPSLKAWKSELLLALIVLSRSITMIVELVAEIPGRSALNEGTWWADPTRSVSDLKHFLGQLAGTELKPWMVLLDGDSLDQFNISALSRLPHSAVLVIIFLLYHLLRHRRFGKDTLARTALALWFLNFLWMLKIVPDFFRVPVDYIYRDVLLVLAMVTVPIVISKRATSGLRESRKSQYIPVVLVVGLTSFSVAVSNPVSQAVFIGAPSPFALVGLARQSDNWDKALNNPEDGDRHVLAVIDPVFLSRWQDESIENPRERNWKGLRGFYQLRQAGVVSLEGSPKIRDATAFTGNFNSLKQSLEAPSPEFCDAVLLGLLRVDKIVTSSLTTLPCLTTLNTTTRKIKIPWEISEPRQLSDSKMYISSFNFEAAIAQNSTLETTQQPMRCGLLAEPDCVTKLGLRPSSQWSVSDQNCSMPCLLRLKRQGTEDSEMTTLVLPFNDENSIVVTDDTRNQIPHTQVNGLVAIPTDRLDSSSLTVRVVPDSRMWLQIFIAFFQYVFLLPPIFIRLKNMLRNRA